MTKRKAARPNPLQQAVQRVTAPGAIPARGSVHELALPVFVRVENTTGFVVTYDVVAEGVVVVIKLRDVEPEPGALWPE